MQEDATAPAGYPRWLPSLLIAVAVSAAVVSGVVVFIVWPLVSIQLRLSRNGAIARQLVQSLQARFPGVSCRGAASYEKEVIYIHVVGPVDEPTRREVEQWLRGQKTEQKILPEIWLRFGDDVDDSDTIKMSTTSPGPLPAPKGHPSIDPHTRHGSAVPWMADLITT